MAHAVSWMDRLRIERAVWALDQRLYELPRRSRVATRREVRNDLVAASQDVGTHTALRNLGGTRRLAEAYVDAELGDTPRPSWFAAGVFLLLAQLVLTSVLHDAASAFADGVRAASPSATGTFTWPGVAYLQDEVAYTFTNGASTFVGGAWTPFAWIVWIVATILVGRLWRVVPQVRRRRAVARA